VDRPSALTIAQPHARAAGVLVVLALAACSSPSSNSTCESSGKLGGTCANTTAGQCVDFTNLGNSDVASAEQGCVSRGGTWGPDACPTTGRIGSCQIPPNDPNTDVTCSPDATILLRYSSPRYDLAKAMAACAGAPGTIFTPN